MNLISCRSLKLPEESVKDDKEFEWVGVWGTIPDQQNGVAAAHQKHLLESIEPFLVHCWILELQCCLVHC